MRTGRLPAVGTLIGLLIAASAVAGAPASVSVDARIGHKSTSIVSSQDGDLFAERGEQIGLTVELSNIGTGPATGITATLSSTILTVQQATSGYPDLAPGSAATNGTPFTASLPATALCADGLRGTLTVNTQQGSFTVPVVVPVSAVGRPESWTSTTPVDISDLATVESPLTLGAGPTSTILDLNVRVDDLSHTWDADLFISLLQPRGGPINLAVHRGFGANFTNTVFDDEANATLADGSPPFSGTFRPDSTVTLAAVDGSDATGIWRLRVRDDDSGDVGRLNSWGIDAVTARCNEPPSAGFEVNPLDPIVGKPATLRSNSIDHDGQVASHAWDLDNDGAFDDGTGTTATHTFSAPGAATVSLRVVDDLGNAAVGSTELTVVRPRAPRRVCRVPRVVGMRLAAARRAITRAGCRVGRVRRARSRRVGRVVRQSPRRGAQRPQGTRVNLVVGRR